MNADETEVQRTVDTIAGMLPALARNRAEHWLVREARTATLYATSPLRQSLQWQFIGAIKTLAREGSFESVRELVSALEQAERIAEERQP